MTRASASALAAAGILAPLNAVTTTVIAPGIPVHSEEIFRRLVDSVQDYAIFVLDTQGYVVTWNPGAERSTGYKAHEIIGKHFSTFYSQQDKDKDKPERELKVASEVGRFEDEDRDGLPGPDRTPAPEGALLGRGLRRRHRAGLHAPQAVQDRLVERQARQGQIDEGRRGRRPSQRFSGSPRPGRGWSSACGGSCSCGVSWQGPGPGRS